PQGMGLLRVAGAVAVEVPVGAGDVDDQLHGRLLTHRGPPISIPISAGYWSQVRPSSSRPLAFGVRPPHCLKKNAVPVSRHWSRTSRTQSACIGRALAPDSPPTITQSMPSRFNDGSGPRSGSRDRNRTAAGVWRRWLARKV